jgi:hypothetical protein
LLVAIGVSLIASHWLSDSLAEPERVADSTPSATGADTCLAFERWEATNSYSAKEDYAPIMRQLAAIRDSSTSEVARAVGKVYVGIDNRETSTKELEARFNELARLCGWPLRSRASEAEDGGAASLEEDDSSLASLEEDDFPPWDCSSGCTVGEDDPTYHGPEGNCFGCINDEGNPKDQWVDDYTRSDGTEVEGYWRNDPCDGLGDSC